MCDEYSLTNYQSANATCLSTVSIKLIDVMTESEIRNKTGSPIESKWKLDKDLEFASGKAQAAAKAWISLRRLANQRL